MAEHSEALFTEAQIQKTVADLSQQISLWIIQLKTPTLQVVSVLDGAKPFTGDLLVHLRKKHHDLEIVLHEVRIKGTDGTHLLKERVPMSGFPQIKGKDPILLVDDLVDSGLTLKLLKEALMALKAGPVKTAVLIRKFGKKSGPVDFCGFELDWSHEKLAAKGLKDCWLYGYGMDLNGHQRDLKHIKKMNIH